VQMAWKIHEPQILTEPSRGDIFPARYDPAPMVPHVSVAVAGYRWRVRPCHVGVVHAGTGVVRAARVDSVVHARCRNLSGGVRTLPGYL
jgi:hypothetical protein